MRKLIKTVSLTALVGLAGASFSASAWWGGGPGGGNSVNDWFGDGSDTGDFDMSFSGSGSGRGWGRGTYRYYDGYGYGPGWGGGPVGLWWLPLWRRIRYALWRAVAMECRMAQCPRGFQLSLLPLAHGNRIPGAAKVLEAFGLGSPTDRRRRSRVHFPDLPAKFLAQRRAGLSDRAKAPGSFNGILQVSPRES